MTKHIEMNQIIRIVAGEIKPYEPPPWWYAIQHLVENKFCILCYGGKDLTSCNWQDLNTENKDIAIIQYSEAFPDIMDAIEFLELKNVTLITNNMSLQSTESVSVHVYSWFEHMHSYHQNNFGETTQFNKQCKTYDDNKKFISLNGRRNLTRLFMIFGLHARGLLDQGYVSLLPPQWKKSNIVSWRDAVKAVMEFTQGTSESAIIPSNAKFIESLTVDREVKGCNPMQDIMSNRWLFDVAVDNVLDGPNHRTLQPMIDNTYFTVINETMTNTNDPIFFTEKTFKVIQYGHPFVLCSVPGALAKLREMGYKTFHPYIDESYDLEVDDLTRYVKILEQINILCNMRDSKRIELLDNTRHIVEHNHNTLRNKTNWIYNERTLD